MTNAFSRLPLELLLIILRHVPDLPSLYSFICASARANDAFEIDSACIVDELLERSMPFLKHLARMVAILGSLKSQASPYAGSLDSSSPLTFDLFVSNYRGLRGNDLTVVPPLSPFLAGTPGPRYLLLTAYRIEHLRHICLVTLLQNIHEQIFVPSDDEDFKLKPGDAFKQFRPGVSFHPVAWWSPSWVERFRVERALWKLMVYWNIRAIHPELAGDDPEFHRYTQKIQDITPVLGPKLERELFFPPYEVEEMNCVAAAIHSFLDCAPFEFFTTYSSQARKVHVTKAWSDVSLILKETAEWKFEEPKPSNSALAQYWGQGPSTNGPFRGFPWTVWTGLSDFSYSERRDLRINDYLGLCLWDTKRLVYLGLEHIDNEDLDSCLGRPSDIKFYGSDTLKDRWRDLYLDEMIRSLGRKRMFPTDRKRILDYWTAGFDSKFSWGFAHRLGIRTSVAERDWVSGNLSEVGGA